MIAAMRLLRPVDDERVRAHFEQACNQYAREKLVNPPLHTKLELDRVVQVLRRASPAPEGPVVDFGAGTGRLTLALAQAGYRVVAVDLSRSSLAILRHAARDLGLDEIETRTTLPAGSFSAVVGADVLHHVDLDEYLPSIHRILRPGGTVVFSEPRALNPAWYVYLALRHGFRFETGILSCNVATLRRRFLRAGFRNVTVTGVGVLPRPLIAWSERACRRHDALGAWPILRWFAYRYLVQATR